MFLFLLVLLAGSPDSLRVAVAPAETLQVTFFGEGPPVVFVPGVFGSAFGFRNVAARLTEAGLQSVVVEPLGIGAATRPRDADYSLTAQADRIAAVLDSLALRDVIVVAHSLGGSIALRLAYRRPDLVRAVVSLEGGPAESASRTGLRSVSRYSGLLKLFGAGAARRKFRGTLIKASGDPSWVTDSVVERYTTGPERGLGAMLNVISLMVAAVEPEPLEPRLRQVQCPVHLMIGLAPHPETVKAEEIERLRRHLPAFTIDSVPGAGHHLHEERPDAVARLIVQVHASTPPALLVAGAGPRPHP